MINLYEILGVDKRATQGDIKEAYRNKAMENHPDKGGDTEKFRIIDKAYKILSDNDKRKRYDNGESAESIDGIANVISQEQETLRMVLGIFNAIIENIDVSRQDIFDLMRQSIRANQGNIRSEKAKLENNIKKCETVKKRIKKKGNSDLFIQFLDGHIKEYNLAINKMDNIIKLGDDGLKLIKECEYDVEVLEFVTIGDRLRRENVRRHL